MNITLTHNIILFLFNNFQSYGEEGVQTLLSSHRMERKCYDLVHFSHSSISFKISTFFFLTNLQCDLKSTYSYMYLYESQIVSKEKKKGGGKDISQLSAIIWEPLIKVNPCWWLVLNFWMHCKKSHLYRNFLSKCPRIKSFRCPLTFDIAFRN